MLKIFKKFMAHRSWKIKDNNHVFIKDNGKIKELMPYEKINGLTISLKGKDNVITIEKPFQFINSAIFFDCSNSFVSIGANSICNTLRILNNGGFSNRNVTIGKNFSCWGCEILLNGRNNGVVIGDDCVFSKEIHIMNGDGHTIFYNATNNQHLEDIKIGNNVWIGMGVYILKNSCIADGTVVVAASVCCKKFLEPNVAIAGNPAKVIKHGISWKK